MFGLLSLWMIVRKVRLFAIRGAQVGGLSCRVGGRRWARPSLPGGGVSCGARALTTAQIDSTSSIADR
jgi:hypothetical protein